MTEDQKRVKIAEACGWLRMSRMGREVYYDPAGGHVMPHELPEYFHDLNDCADMEATLTDEEFGTYHDLLLNEINSSRFISATATQRAEAFGRVKGLWE